MSIDRYTMEINRGEVWSEPDQNGAYVAYDDHAALVAELKKALAYAIREADGWYDDCRGGKIETPEMDAARKLAE